ncbi:hypothetical protein K469DRAFT_705206 [Zopfia rhizophila CBS 207.26]|uniref:Secreted protein n=1 Tax=Zopfia rhizophila CBS 207.26 TaxID=1314779 RepID=A0A6A6EBJ5_9PEZI|nr:hypothetical protein K469DRAFT_705206 [Zopfia rhizophila CBS 207.26]
MGSILFLWLLMLLACLTHARVLVLGKDVAVSGWEGLMGSVSRHGPFRVRKFQRPSVSEGSFLCLSFRDGALLRVIGSRVILAVEVEELSRPEMVSAVFSCSLPSVTDPNLSPGTVSTGRLASLVGLPMRIPSGESLFEYFVAG